MSLDLDISARIEGVYTGPSGLAQAEQTLNVKELLTFMTGSASGQAQYVYAGTRNLAASASETLDLNGALLDAYGQTINMTSLKAILIKAHDDNTNSVILGDAATNAQTGFLGATGTLTLEPGDFALLVSKGGFTVTPATADLLKVANSGAGTAVNYDIVLIGG